MIIVHAPQDTIKKRNLWVKLTNLIEDSQVMSIILGDFNEVRSENERLGSLFCKSGAKQFKEFISNSELVDLPMGDDALILGKWSLENAKTFSVDVSTSPTWVFNYLEKLRRNFFWGGSLECNKMAWITWKKVRSSSKYGGLGVDRLQPVSTSTYIDADSTRCPVCDEAIGTSQHLHHRLSSMIATWWGFADFLRALGDVIQ
ncbi:cytochrome P450 [Tanacetum coccineum]